MSDNAKTGKKLKFSFKTMLVIYLVIISIIVFVWSKWAKYKYRRMAEEHNAKALQLFGSYTTDENLVKLSKLIYITEPSECRDKRCRIAHLRCILPRQDKFRFAPQSQVLHSFVEWYKRVATMLINQFKKESNL